MSAEVELLREAAARMREWANAASGGTRWSAGDAVNGEFLYQYGDFGFYVTGPAGSPEFADSEQGKADARHVASWDGPPALAVSALLEQAANDYKTEWDTPECPNCGEGCGGHGKREYCVRCDNEPSDCPCIQPFVAVARKFLRREAVVSS